MPSDARPPERFRFFVFTCRDPKSDFRLPLVDALRHHYETYYIWLRRRPIVSGPTARGRSSRAAFTWLTGPRSIPKRKRCTCSNPRGTTACGSR